MAKQIIMVAGWAIWLLSLLVIAYDSWNATGHSDVFFALISGFAVVAALVVVPVLVDARLGPNA